IFPGDDDRDALHLGAFEQKQLVGEMTILHKAPVDFADDVSKRIWLLRGMATLPCIRGLGYGAALVCLAPTSLVSTESICGATRAKVRWASMRRWALAFEASGSTSPVPGRITGCGARSLPPTWHTPYRLKIRARIA